MSQFHRSDNYFDFTRCQRADGTHYGTAGQCQKGREVDARIIPNIIRKIRDSLAKLQSNLTKSDVAIGMVNHRAGLIGKSSSLGNGVAIATTNVKELEGLKDVAGIPRPIASVIGKNNEIIVARKTHKPWAELKLPSKPDMIWLESPMKQWLDVDDLDMAVNPTLLSANSLLKPAFDRYNKEFFDGKLPDTNLFIAPSLTKALGFATYDRQSKEYQIGLSWRHFKNASEEVIHGTLLHEMTHIWAYSNKMYSEGHGKNFTRKLESIDKSWQRETKGIFTDQMYKTMYGDKPLTIKRQFPFLDNYQSALERWAVEKPYPTKNWL